MSIDQQGGLGSARVLLVGCGKMGSAMLNGWMVAGVDPANAMVVEPGATAGVPRGVTWVFSADKLPADFVPDVTVLAVKPQMMDAAAPGFRPFVAKGGLVLSVAAGKRIAAYEGYFGSDTPVVRAMPNTPAAVGRGASVLVANANVRPEQRELAERLMAAVGTTDWIDDEDLMHVVTAMSGGGPAYVFLLIEVMAAAAAKLGLPEDLAMRLARTTVSGSGELARLSPEPAAQLRQNVTSPNGTTQEALAVLMGEDGIQQLFDKAIAAAAKRSVELG
ncbi:MAG TPA: pyrroline-5-carboxylate reductase [Geminicoccus sp.]|uniref:pyrroline-5-carboxylate reductase n=1 Tax=Geminicoccus sp. TaxID=2024832 RepID=UPI002E334594|nr:pyrroline-5-carboxylate reductase [Geminicoccus sp.]HEX2528743.1 pyrroline-5-carboxylate reductase [Geminicoccus sp.]